MREYSAQYKTKLILEVLQGEKELGTPDILDFLRHHGVKGQKWGVRRGPPYPLNEKPPIKEVLAKSLERGTIVKDAIRSGQVSKIINREKQMRHTLSGHLPGRSYLYGDLDYAQDLIDIMVPLSRPLP